MARLTRQEYNKRYYARHRESLLQRQSEYYHRTKELFRGLRQASKRKSRIKNRDKIAIWNKEYYAKHKDDYYRRRISYLYNVSPEDYVKLVERANGHCQLCDRYLAETKTCLDHDHKTGKVRGLLCHRCNIHLDWFETYASAAEKYLADTN